LTKFASALTWTRLCMSSKLQTQRPLFLKIEPWKLLVTDQTWIFTADALLEMEALVLAALQAAVAQMRRCLSFQAVRPRRESRKRTLDPSRLTLNGRKTSCWALVEEHSSAITSCASNRCHSHQTLTASSLWIASSCILCLAKDRRRCGRLQASQQPSRSAV